MKELRISAILEVPDDIWAQTDMLAGIKPAVEAFSDALKAAGGEIEVSLVTPKPRAEKGDPAAQYSALGGKVPA